MSQSLHGIRAKVLDNEQVHLVCLKTNRKITVDVTGEWLPCLEKAIEAIGSQVVSRCWDEKSMTTILGCKWIDHHIVRLVHIKEYLDSPTPLTGVRGALGTKKPDTDAPIVVDDKLGDL